MHNKPELEANQKIRLVSQLVSVIFYNNALLFYETIYAAWTLQILSYPL